MAIASWLIVATNAGADEAGSVRTEYVPTDNGITPDDLWALAPIERPALPEVKRPDWPSGAIDRFVLARLEADAMEPAPRL
ncbi:MAG: hypothetical protein WD403_01435 [Pirellulales bacterium]